MKRDVCATERTEEIRWVCDGGRNANEVKSSVVSCVCRVEKFGGGVRSGPNLPCCKWPAPVHVWLVSSQSMMVPVWCVCSGAQALSGCAVPPGSLQYWPGAGHLPAGAVL